MALVNIADTRDSGVGCVRKSQRTLSNHLSKDISNIYTELRVCDDNKHLGLEPATKRRRTPGTAQRESSPQTVSRESLGEEVGIDRLDQHQIQES